MVEYARKGLIGVLTPQANTTVEPEFAILMPPGYAVISARLVSDKPTIEERLDDYFTTIESSIAQFANAPMRVLAFACTGASYLQGIERECAAVEAIERRRGISLLTAGRAVAEALRCLGGRRIGLVSPYPPHLTEASIAYWRAYGFEIVTVASAVTTASDFHPVYDLPRSIAEDALAAIDLKSVDAVVMLGTGVPTLGPILNLVGNGSTVPVLSCTSALAWRSLVAFDADLAEEGPTRRYFAGEGWRERFRRAMA
jgi:maleate isomerase